MNFSLRKALLVTSIFFFLPSLGLAQDAGSVNLQGLQRAITTIEGQTRSSDYEVSAEVIRLEAAGSVKFPKPSAVRVNGLCSGIENVIETSLYRSLIADSDFTNACEQWGTDTASLQRVVKNYYENPGRTACVTDGAAAANTNTCRPTTAQITYWREKVTASRASLVPEARVTNAENSVENLESRYAAECGTPEKRATTACTELQTQIDTAKTAAEQANATADQPSGPCSGLQFLGNFGYCAWQGVVYIFKAFIIGVIAGPILTISGLIFDYSLYFGIIKFPELLRGLGASSSESSIYATWVIVRNLFNIIIVFQLLKIAIYKILTPVLSKSPGDLKRLLMSIIVFTLFVNFSFFFTKALIDISNITALQFYSGMGGSQSEDGNFTQGNIGIAIAEGLGISTRNILQVAADAVAPPSAQDYGGVTVASGTTVQAGTFEDSILGVIILFCLLMLASFVLIQGAAIFITRSVILIFLIVFSPLMFARNIVGFVNTWSEKWWDMLLEQLFVAPLYLGMLFLTLKMAGDGQSYGILTILSQEEGAFGSGYFASAATMIIQGAIMAGLFISAVKLAKDFGGAAAKKSSAWGAKAYGAAVGGAGGAVMRRGLGGAANRFSNSQKWKDRAAGTGIGAAASRGLLSIADKGKNSTFDFRNSSALKGANGMAGKFGLDLKDAGAGAGGGFVTERAAADKKREDKIKREQELLKTDTYGMSPEEKKKAEKADKERQERARAGQTITASTTDEEFEKLKRNEEGLDGDELKYAQEYNKSIEEARKQAQTRLGQIQSGASTVRSRITGRATGSDIAARGTALGRTDDENKKLKQAEVAKRRNDSVKKILDEFSETDTGELRDEAAITHQITTELSVLEANISRMQQNSANLTEEQKADLVKQQKRARTLKDSKTRIKSWVKNRDNNMWRSDEGKKDKTDKADKGKDSKSEDEKK